MSRAECAKLPCVAPRRDVPRGSLLLLLLLLLPGLSRGQEPSGNSHEVDRGDTLWGLADRYLNAGPRWREIYDLNRSEIQDPDLIRPGQVFRLPGRSSVAASATASTDAEPASSTVPEAGIESRTRPQESPFGGPSIFDRSPERGVTLGGFEVEAAASLPLVSPSDFHRAPFLATKEEVEPTARTAREIVANPLDLRLPATIALNHRVVLELGAVRAATGDRLLAFKWGRSVRRHGRIVEPVALLSVLEVNADSALAQVTQVFGPYQVGDPVIGAEVYPEPPPTDLRTAEATVTGEIVAFAADQPLLGLSEVAFLDVGSVNGVQLGDEFVAFREDVPDAASAHFEDGQALLRVVRVRPASASVVVVRMRDAGTTDRAPVRLVGQAVSAAP